MVRRVPAPYAQIAQEIRDLIHAGRLRPGDMVPSARDLAARHGVSRATADKALAALRSEGLVVPRIGIGTIVADLPGRQVQSGYQRFRRMLSVGRATRPGERSEIVSAAVVPAPHDVAAALNLDEGAPVVRRERRFVDDEGVVALSVSWLPGELADAVPALVSTERITGGTIGAVREATGRHPATCVDTVTARLATPEETQALGLESPAAVLVITARLVDEDGAPIEYGVDVTVRPWSVGYDLNAT